MGAVDGMVVADSEENALERYGPAVKDEDERPTAEASAHADYDPKAGAPRDLHLAPDPVEVLASVLRSASWDLDGEIARTKDANRRTTLLDRRRLLEGVASELTPGDASCPSG